FAGAMIEIALAAADAAEVETQDREVARREAVIELVDDLMIHRPAELRVRMQDDRDRRVPRPGRVETAFNPAGGTGEDDFGHIFEPLGRRCRLDSRFRPFRLVRLTR